MALSWAWEEKLALPISGRVGGIDEAGRGCLAGPVVAAIYVFPRRTVWPEGLGDSKQLTRAERQRLFQELTNWPGASFGIGEATPAEIDRFNILEATVLAMRRAIQKLSAPCDGILVDGRPLKNLGSPHLAIVKGDSLSPSIAAASILAKETRDRIMEALDQSFPGYGFANHKGYGTAVHTEALRLLGPCAVHRRSFAPIRQATLPGF